MARPPFSSRRFTSIVVLLVSLFFGFSRAAASPLDFSNDGIADVSWVRIGGGNTLSWNYRDSTSGSPTSLSELGVAGNHIAAARWKNTGPALQGVVAANAGAVLWRVFDGSAIQEFSHGLTSDLIVSGGDFDGSGSADAGAVEIRSSALVWKVMLDPIQTGNRNVTETEFGVLGDLPFFLRYDGNKDWFAVIRRAQDGTATVVVRDPLSSTETSFTLSRKLKTLVRPTPINRAGSSPLLIIPSRSASTTRLLMFGMDGSLIRRPILSGTGDFVVGNFSANQPGEEVALKGRSRLTLYNPTQNKRSLLAVNTSILVDGININSFSEWGPSDGGCTERTPNDGSRRGFVWKPNSDTQHYAVAVLPARYTTTATKVTALSTSGTTINSLRNKGCGNPDNEGPRCGWIATPYTGSKYQSDFGSIKLKVTLSGGTCDVFHLTTPRVRID